MFKRQFISLAILWLILAFACFWVFRNPSSDHRMAYQRLMSLSDQAKTDQMKEEMRPTQQTRYQVSKQILYKKDKDRLQSRLFSEGSELIFDPKGDEAELVEHFQGLTCAMQEKLIDTSKNGSNNDSDSPESLQSKQYIRTLKASDAIYSYKTGQLEADVVEVKHYLISGISFPISLDPFHPILQGRAQKLQLSLFKEPNLKAQGFQAIFHEWGNEW